MKKVVQFFIALSVFISIPAVYGDGAPLKRERRYHMRVYSFDVSPHHEDGSFGDGQYDYWRYSTLEGRTIKTEIDFNNDGQVDMFTESFRMKNVEIEVRDRTFDGISNEITFSFPDREYYLYDSDDNGHIETLIVTHLDTGTSTSARTTFDIGETVHVLSRTQCGLALLDLLFSMLESSDGWLDEWMYISNQVTKKERELQTLLKQQKWDLLFEKTLNYLDLPSKDYFDIALIVDPKKREKNGSIKGGKMTPLLKLTINHPELDISWWLFIVDHEVLHAIQNERFFRQALKQTNTSRDPDNQLNASYKDFIKCSRAWFSCNEMTKEEFNKLNSRLQSIISEREAVMELEDYISGVSRAAYYGRNPYTWLQVCTNLLAIIKAIDDLETTIPDDFYYLVEDQISPIALVDQYMKHASVELRTEMLEKIELIRSIYKQQIIGHQKEYMKQ